MGLMSGKLLFIRNLRVGDRVGNLSTPPRVACQYNDWYSLKDVLGKSERSMLARSL